MSTEYSHSCILVYGNLQSQRSEAEVLSDIEELKSLALTLELDILDSIILNIKKLSSSLFYGKGQLESLKSKVKAIKSRYIIFNDEISASQFKNIQKLFGKDIIIFDRTGIILEIFKNNAKTRESKCQVELASLQYMLPRLTRQWTHLERQMGGKGTRGGPGEKQIEIDRRLIGQKITKLKKELNIIKKSRQTQALSRSNIYRASLVGYTNAGKSSLLNALCKPYTTYVEDKLFATLDTTTRNISLAKNQNTLITDTVGFIKNLPHNLVASFRSTFEEVASSNLILIVLDSSSSRTIIEEHMNTIKSTLKSLKISIKNEIYVFNKIDKITQKQKINYLKKKYPDASFISAKNHIMIDSLKKNIFNIINRDVETKNVKIPHSKSYELDRIYKTFKIEDRKEGYNYIKMKISGNKKDFNKIKEYIS